MQLGGIMEFLKGAWSPGGNIEFSDGAQNPGWSPELRREHTALEGTLRPDCICCPKGSYPGLLDLSSLALRVRVASESLGNTFSPFSLGRHTLPLIYLYPAAALSTPGAQEGRKGRWHPLVVPADSTGEECKGMGVIVEGRVCQGL